jgi:hypothetical protein
MTKLCIFAGTVLFGYGFGYFAAPLGFFWAFFISGIGSVLGVWVGWKVAQKIERG